MISGLVSNSILGASSSKTESMLKIALGIELGLYQWLLTSSVLGLGVGVVGVGVCSGTLIVTPNGGVMEGAFKANGLVGGYASGLWVPVMLGISKSYAFVGESVLVGSGGFTGGFVGDVSLLTQSLLGSFSSLGIVGIETPRLSVALAQGIYGHFQLGLVAGAIVGSAGPSPSTGQITGRFI